MTKVLRSSNRLAAKKASSLASNGSSAGATIGTVGHSNASKPCSACSARTRQAKPDSLKELNGAMRARLSAY